MAKTKYLGQNDALYLIQLIHTELAKYVKAVSGKGLSEEDFTSALKTKLDGIDISLYSTTTDMNNAISNAITSAIQGLTGVSFTKVADFASLPTTGVEGTIYLVPKTTTGTNDVYDEYYWDVTANKYESLGSTTVDLTGYLQTTDLEELTQAEVKAVWDSVFTVSP